LTQHHPTPPLFPYTTLFRSGDTYIDNIFFGESVYQPLHDPMFALNSNPPADQLAQWRRMAMEIAKDGLPLHVHAELHDTIDAFLDRKSTRLNSSHVKISYAV